MAAAINSHVDRSRSLDGPELADQILGHRVGRHEIRVAMRDKDFELAFANARLFQLFQRSRIALPAGFCSEVPVPVRFPVEQPVFEIRAETKLLSQVIDDRWSKRGDGSVKDRIVMRVLFGLRHWHAYRSIVAAERAVLALFVLTDESDAETRP